MKRNLSIILILLIIQLISTGCTSVVSKLKFDGITSVCLKSMALSSSELGVTCDIYNSSPQSITVHEISLLSEDIDDFYIELNDAVILEPGKNIVEFPLKVNYSLGSAFALIKRIQNGNSDEYALKLMAKISKGNKTPRKFVIRRKISREKLKNLISNLKKGF